MANSNLNMNSTNLHSIFHYQNNNSSYTLPISIINYITNYTELLVNNPEIVTTTTAPIDDLIMNSVSAPPTTIPIEFTKINQRSLNCIIAYTVLFLFAAAGNLSIFLSILTNNYNKTTVKTTAQPTATCTTTNHHHVNVVRPTPSINSQNSKSYSKITLLILNLSIADLIVTFFLMPMEIFWRISVKWIAGNLLCKFCQFGRAFGLYLSSMIIICISLDRFFAIMYPLKIMDGQRRIRRMLIAAWIVAIFCSAPQSFIFSVKTHPVYTSFEQCVSIGYFSNHEEEIIYNVFSVSAMYFLPIIVIIFTYSTVLWKLIRKANEQQRIIRTVNNSLRSPLKRVQAHRTLSTTPICMNPNGDEQDSRESSIRNPPNSTGNNKSSVILNVNELMTRDAACKNAIVQQHEAPAGKKVALTLRTSDNGMTTFARARTRTLRLTLVIVIAFLICSVPYVFMTLWYMFDRESAEKVNGGIQDGFFMMVVANSCMNPIIYGSFSKNCNMFWWMKLFRCFKKTRRSCSIISSSEEQGQGQHPQQTSTSSQILSDGHTIQQHQSPTRRHLAKDHITWCSLVLRRIFSCFDLSRHYFHNNIISHHHRSNLNIRQVIETSVHEQEQSQEEPNDNIRANQIEPDIMTANTLSTIIID